MARLNLHHSPIVTVLWSPDGRRLGTVSRREARVWTVGAREERSVPLKDASNLSSASWSLDGRFIAIGTDNGIVHVWDAIAESVTVLVDPSHRTVTAVEWSPAGDRLAVAHWGSIVRIWSSRTGKQLAELQLPNSDALGIVTDTSWSPDGTWLAAAAIQAIAAWETQDWARYSLPLDSKSIDRIEWAPNGQHLGASMSKADILLWTPSTRRKRVLRGFTAEHTPQKLLVPPSIAWSPDSLRLAAAYRDSSARIWNVETGRPELVLRSLPGTDGSEPWWLENGIWQPSIAWSRDRVALTTWDGSIWLWSASTGTQSAVLRGTREPGPADLIAFSPDGRRLAQAAQTVDSAFQIVVWDTSWLDLDLAGRINFSHEAIKKPMMRPRLQEPAE